METKVHFRVDFEGLTRIVRDFWAEGEYVTALAVMTESGIPEKQAKDVIRGKKKMAQYPGDEDQGWIVKDNWVPKAGYRYPDPDDTAFFKMVNRYGVKGLEEMEQTISTVINTLKRTVYSIDKIKLIKYLREEKRYPDEVYKFFKLPFPETIETDCDPEDVLPYSSPFGNPYINKNLKAREEEFAQRCIDNNFVPTPAVDSSKDQVARDRETAKQKGTFGKIFQKTIVLDEKEIVYLEITSWVGIGIGATHYYGELRDRDKKVELKDTLTLKQRKALRKKNKLLYDSFEVGDDFSGFDSQEDAIAKARIVWQQEFPHATLLILGRSSIRQPQIILEGPEELKKVVNLLFDRGEKLNWYESLGNLTEVEAINQEWRDLMLKFGYAKEIKT